MKSFDLEGYKFVPAQSDDRNFVFNRPKPPPKATKKTASPKVSASSSTKTKAKPASKAPPAKKPKVAKTKSRK